ncbi:MAG: hypothetical protein QXU67_07190 [Candidatus Bathyarchaeia archaeon]
MKQEAILTQRERCRHSWIELGFSPLNGKIYKRCEKCGIIKEETPEYIK